jgi:hypothetical protein
MPILDFERDYKSELRDDEDKTQLVGYHVTVNPDDVDDTDTAKLYIKRYSTQGDPEELLYFLAQFHCLMVRINGDVITNQLCLVFIISKFGLIVTFKIEDGHC